MDVYDTNQYDMDVYDMDPRDMDQYVTWICVT